MLLRVRAGLLHSIVTAEAKWYGKSAGPNEVPKTGYFPKWVLTYFPSFLGQAPSHTKMHPFPRTRGILSGLGYLSFKALL